MARQRFEVAPGQFVTLAMDDQPPLTMNLWAIVSARLVDNTTGEPVRVPVVIRIGQRGLAPRIAADGLIALAGRPFNLFPNLAGQDYHITFTVYAAGYRPRKLKVKIPQRTGFPGAFDTVNRGDIRLHPI
jgi:hypothetical protein